jgi:hypothetical protein
MMHIYPFLSRISIWRTVSQRASCLPEHADRFCRSHDEGSAEVGFHQLDEIELVIIPRPIPLVVFVLVLLVGSSSKNGWFICLRDEEKQSKCEASSDHDHPVRPTPTFEFGHEATDHRT